MSTLLILRPEPGASQTAARAAALELTCVIAPLFTVRPVAWTLPDGGVDAVMATSANALRHGGAQLGRLRNLPLYAVGSATAEAAREAGFAIVHSAAGDGAALLLQLEQALPGRVLHLVGREHVPLDSPRLAIERRIAYAADALTALPEAATRAIGHGAAALLHSPRAAGVFARLADEAGIAAGRIAIAAISPATAAAAGPGWRSVAVAATPDDDALLAAAARLCEA